MRQDDERRNVIDAALTARRSEHLNDWWIIERAEHDGREWLEPTGYKHVYRSSARISSADVEGTSDEMEEIAAAIETRGSFEARRCAVSVRGEAALLWSPRNRGFAARVPLSRADALAAEIRSKLHLIRGEK